MIYDSLYDKFVKNLSIEHCKHRLHEAFLYASWKELAANIETVFKTLGETKSQTPNFVRLGYLDYSFEGGGLAAPVAPEIKNQMQVPYLFDWSSYRGMVLSNKLFHQKCPEADMSVVRQTASSMLLRLLLQAEKDTILIHKVDPANMGKDMVMIPHQPNAPIIVDKEGLGQLLAKFRSQIANNPVEALSWRCEENENSYATDNEPLHIVFIGDWNALYDVRGGEVEVSKIQQTIFEMVNNEVAARNGIYFVICTDYEDAEDFEDMLPQMKISCTSFSPSSYCAQFSSKVSRDRKAKGAQASKETAINQNMRLALPTNDELLTIQKSHRNFHSGTMMDAEGAGLWQGNSANGLRAIMGITPQGENQFFELGVGQAFDAFHALIGGATGSGKSVLLREIICSLAERYSPNELRMLLLDYKEGTEFAPFAKLPHVFALSIGSNPEFGLEVLKETQREIVRRGQLFKDAGNAKNLEEYRRLTGKTLCRYVLVADEFQVLLSDKKFGEEAKTVLNDLVRRGRAFGFNAILATQTLRDGALDGEAKNQFGCRIAMRMAESETDYFLGAGNTIPSTFNRKGQALLNYALGRKESNILFQSGNKEMPKKFRDSAELNECLDMLHSKAVAENCLPADVYIYNSDGFAAPPADADPANGVLIGLRNNMQGTPMYLNQRQLSAKVLIVGGSQQKQDILLQTMCAQLSDIYGEPVEPQTPGDYLDAGVSRQVTIFRVPEGDFDLEDAITEWQEAGTTAANTAISAESSSQAATDYAAPQGMESEFADLMAAMQANSATMAAMGGKAQSSPNQGGSRDRRRNRDTRCLVIALSVIEDIKLLEAAGLYAQDFRSTIYLDNNAYNQISGNYESGQLGESAALLESPRGVVTKLRLVKN